MIKLTPSQKGFTYSNYGSNLAPLNLNGYSEKR